MMAIDEMTTVVDLLAVHPQAFGVLRNHGMCEDCKADPPAVPLHHFAAKHCGGDIKGLLGELKEVIGTSA